MIRRDKEGSYIPACTRNVFLKYYTESGNQQLHFWSAADRHAYLGAIQKVVGPYLQPQEVDGVTAVSRRTSFFSLTGDDQPDDDLAVERIEIPLFQRDYAQGRDTDPVRRIRADFLDVLRTAVAGDEPAPVGLDFIYGGVDEGTLRPLDGQQRLTTLFLLHWYIASRSDHLAEDHGWKHFSYATRQSARMFSESLVAHPLPDGDWDTI